MSEVNTFTILILEVKVEKLAYDNEKFSENTYIL